MTGSIEVTFHGGPRDPSVEAAVHRWVSRLEPLHPSSTCTQIIVDRRGRRRTTATLTLMLEDGASCETTASNEDAYLAIADAFRAARLELLRRPRLGVARV